MKQRSLWFYPISLLTALSLWIPGVGASGGGPVTITVVTVQRLPVAIPPAFTAITTEVMLDRLSAIEEQLSRGLDQQPDGRRAARIGRRLNAQHRREIRAIWQALARIHAGQITHLPAIVLDDRAVWYGQSVRRAVTQYGRQRPTGNGS